MIRNPRFIIIGAGRSGTTSLYHYLRQHPQIFMPALKETNYFARDHGAAGADGADGLAPPPDGGLFAIRSAPDYASLFAGAPPGAITGEASPLYMYAPGTAERIHRARPDARLIAILRSPVDRAWSNYLGCVRDGVERRSFERAVREERAASTRSLRGSDNYLRAGLYARNLKPYYDLFTAGGIATVLFDDFTRDPGEVLDLLHRFLGVDPAFRADTSIRYNATGIPRSRALHRLLGESAAARWAKSNLSGKWKHALMKLATGMQRSNLKRTSVDDALRAELIEFYREDVVELQSMIGRDLRHWMTTTDQ